MKTTNSSIAHFIKIIFLTAMSGSVSGALISATAALLGLPIIGWALLYISLICFVVLLGFGITALFSVISRAIKNRSSSSKEVPLDMAMNPANHSA